MYARIGIASLVLLLGCAHLAPSGYDPTVCRVGVIRSNMLRLGADPVYVEPQTVAAGDNGRTLVGGRLNYRFTRGEKSYRPVEPPFGLILEAGGGVTPVPHPLLGRVTDGVRAVGIPGGWGVGFAEMRVVQGRPDSVIALWYGEVRNGEWSSLERITDEPLDYNVRAVSDLVRTNDGIAWIVPAKDDELHLLMLQRSGSGWTVERVPSAAVRAEPLIIDGTVTGLTTLQADPELDYDDSSLLLVRRSGGWRVSQVLSAGLDEPATNIGFQQTQHGGILTWIGRKGPIRTLRARVFDEYGLHRRHTVAEGIEPMGPLRSVSLPTDEVVWGSTYAEGDERAIRLTILRADTVGTLYEFPNPFVGGFQMAVQADSLLLLGAAAQGTQFFSLLKLAVPVQCGPVPA